jgi:carbonic anhydrase
MPSQPRARRLPVTGALLIAAVLSLGACQEPSDLSTSPALDPTFARATNQPAGAPAALPALARFEGAHAALSSGASTGITRDNGGPLWTLLGQSPIDIPLNRTTKLLSQDPQFSWRPFAAEVEEGAHELKVSAVGDAGHIVVRGKSYAMKQFHFHHDSEHAIGGRKGAMEVHFVHQASDGAIAVIGVLLQVGRANDALEPIWPAGGQVGQANAGLTVDASRLLPPTNTPYFTYSGSLTTPPYTDALTWIVYKQPIQLSAAQLARYTARWEEPNARAFQALGDRTVFERVGGGR